MAKGEGGHPWGFIIPHLADEGGSIKRLAAEG